MSMQSEKSNRNNGVALVIVLGLLAILTILAVAFSSAMLVERLAAWNHANSVRAEALVQAGVVRAMRDVGMICNGQNYPCFTGMPARCYDAMGSVSNGPRLTNLLSGEAFSNVPSSLWGDARKVAGSYCYWSNVVVNGRTNGRIAYIVINASGLVDINRAGGRYRSWSTNLAEIDPGNLLTGTLAAFTNQRGKDVRYETMTEAMALNPAIPNPSDAAFVYSMDPARDQFFPKANSMDITAIRTLGRPDAVLANKFNINSLLAKDTNGDYIYHGVTQSWDFAGYSSDPNFIANYYNPLVAILKTCRTNGTSWMMEKPDDVAWNIINYIDPDRIPQCAAGVLPWNSSEGGEAMPLINEIVFKPFTNATYPSNTYEFVVELWYPFAPVCVTPADKYSLWVGVFTNKVAAGVPWTDITNSTYVSTNYTFTTNILDMSYGGIDFICVTSPISKKIRFPAVVSLTNAPPYRYATNYLPLGIQTYNSISNLSVTVTNCVWFLSRVYKEQYSPSAAGGTVNLIVDEAMGYGTPASGTEPFPGGSAVTRELKCFADTVGYSVTDPRSNGRIKYWLTSQLLGGLGPYSWTNTTYLTLGSTNYNCDPWSRSGSGLPIFSTNGAMENIGELGYIWRSNLDSPAEEPRGTNYYWWRTINLMHFDEGAALLDMCTVRPSNTWAYGLVNINSRQTNAIKALLNNMLIGYVSGPSTNFYQLTTAAIDRLARTIITNGPYLNVQSMFTSELADDGGGGCLAAAFRYAGTNNPACRADIFGEDPFRRICELITFRQNIFMVLVAAQVFGGDGESVVGEKRAMAVIYRDSYTGRYFIRSFKWLSD